jgi:DNA-binding response OmpR family regulator
MPQRILIVDDETDELEAWEQLLSKQGYLVRTALTPEAALKACDENRFDLVVLDYVMPKMKGLELLSRIRKSLPLVRSILISGKLDKKVEAKEIRESIRSEVEVDKYLHKPVSNEELSAVISELLKEHPSGRAWNEIADDILQGDKSSVKKAKGAQSKLRNHLRKS